VLCRAGLFVDDFHLGFYHEIMNPQRVSIDEAKSQLSDLITIASEGGEVIIVQDGKPLARLVPAADANVYQSLPPTRNEFSAGDDPLAWDSDGWENVA
jgi:prevent-host-death family protein